MARMKCGVAAVEALLAAGVAKVFGRMGSSTLEMYDALYDAKDMEYIGVRHENCGMNMADAYGRVTQTPGLFICGQAGPGSVNMVPRSSFERSRPGIAGNQHRDSICRAS